MRILGPRALGVRALVLLERFEQGCSRRVDREPSQILDRHQRVSIRILCTHRASVKRDARILHVILTSSREGRQPSFWLTPTSAGTHSCGLHPPIPVSPLS